MADRKSIAIRRERALARIVAVLGIEPPRHREANVQEARTLEAIADALETNGLTPDQAEPAPKRSSSSRKSAK